MNGHRICLAVLLVFLFQGLSAQLRKATPKELSMMRSIKGEMTRLLQDSLKMPSSCLVFHIDSLYDPSDYSVDFNLPLPGPMGQPDRCKIMEDGKLFAAFFYQHSLYRYPIVRKLRFTFLFSANLKYQVIYTILPDGMIAYCCDDAGNIRLYKPANWIRRVKNGNKSVLF